ncbi:hypothetical protein RO3G_08712 [Rhizopus delemar RA 99-880]|uniref:Uncharacterized protein n=1 Tax=Rhizopus delemar (strain RA 99-880 / ATCC MYA-4621 / FGSC 9543 / NRRL 43880) TaxID=246409 RepID=I1C6C7_RHIO9|nr:hypothetical protein RO3G_08712 [Rhizopus delemar RA 99-880]|eukprot:EIE84007.1 hypothetical protein RO3G_08712 [Rhizopus delemar RA 99-880]
MASNPRQYALNVRQQPIQARISTNNERGNTVFPSSFVSRNTERITC